MSHITRTSWGIAAFVLVGVFLISQVALALSTSSLVPTGEGSNLQFTPSTGTTHYTLVDETSCNGTTDYNRTTTVGTRDSYAVSVASIPNGATVTQIAIKPCASRNTSGGGSSTMNVFYRFNGATSSDSGAYALTGTTPIELATTTFSGLSLDKTSTTAAEIGAVYSAGTRGARLSRIATIFIYDALSAPTSLVGMATTSSSIRLTWSDNSVNEDGFEVERSLNGVSWTWVATSTPNTTSYYDNSLSAGTTYYHRVRTFNAGVYSAYTNTATTTTGVPTPNAPSSLTASASSTTVTLNWNDNSSDELAFTIQRRNGNGLFSHIATTSADVITYDDVVTATTSPYVYRIRAWNSGGYSAFSNHATTTVP